MNFKDVAIAQQFDFIDDAKGTGNMEWARMIKTGKNEYFDTLRKKHKFEYLKTEVFHVGPEHDRPIDELTR